MNLLEITEAKDKNKVYHHKVHNGHVLIRYPRWDLTGTILIESYGPDGTTFKGQVVGQIENVTVDKEHRGMALVQIYDFCKLHKIPVVRGGEMEVQKSQSDPTDTVEHYTPGRGAVVRKGPIYTAVMRTRSIQFRLPYAGWTSAAKATDVAGLRGRRRRRVYR
jgi:hypothetical protein